MNNLIRDIRPDIEQMIMDLNKLMRLEKDIQSPSALEEAFLDLYINRLRRSINHIEEIRNSMYGE